MHLWVAGKSVQSLVNTCHTWALCGESDSVKALYKCPVYFTSSYYYHHTRALQCGIVVRATTKAYGEWQIWSHRPLVGCDISLWPMKLRHFQWPWVIAKVTPLLQVFSIAIFVHSCCSWEGFNWPGVSRGPSAMAEFLVKGYYHVLWFSGSVDAKMSIL